jgi:hypothetical protein
MVRTSRQLSRELQRLMAEQTKSLRKEAFGGVTAEERRDQEERLKRIREVSADFLAALERENRETFGNAKKRKEKK